MQSYSYFAEKKARLSEELSRGHFDSRKPKEPQPGALEIRDYFDPATLDRLKFEYHVCLIGEKFETAHALPYGPQKEIKLRAARRAYVKLHKNITDKIQTLVESHDQMTRRNHHFYAVFNKRDNAVSLFHVLTPLSVLATCTVGMFTKSSTNMLIAAVLPFAAISYQAIVLRPAAKKAGKACKESDEITRPFCAANLARQQVEEEKLQELEDTMHEIRRGPLRPRLIVYNDVPSGSRGKSTAHLTPVA